MILINRRDDKDALTATDAGWLKEALDIAFAVGLCGAVVHALAYLVYPVYG